MGISLPAEPRIEPLTEISITKPGSDHQVCFTTNLPGAPTAIVNDNADGSICFTLETAEGSVSVTVSPVTS